MQSRTDWSAEALDIRTITNSNKLNESRVKGLRIRILDTWLCGVKRLRRAKWGAKQWWAARFPPKALRKCHTAATNVNYNLHYIKPQISEGEALEAEGINKSEAIWEGRKENYLELRSHIRQPSSQREPFIYLPSWWTLTFASTLF